MLWRVIGLTWKLNMHAPFKPAILLPGIIYNILPHSEIFIASWFAAANDWKQSKCLLIGDRLNKS